MPRLENRWEKGKDHHPLAEEFYNWLEATGVEVETEWKFGGDGDDGELILLALSEFFEDIDSHQWICPREITHAST